MPIDIQLFEGKLIRLAPADHEKDPEVESHWTHGSGNLRMAIGDPGERNKGCGGDTLGLMLRYAFQELNLRRVSLDTIEYNPRAIRLYQKAGFVREGCARDFLFREGKRWEMIFIGILREEWQAQNFNK